MAGIKVTGIKELEKALRKNATMDKVKQTVRKNGAELQTKIQENADFTKGYQTGTTKRNVSLEITDGGLSAESGPETEYSPYLEYGTRFMEAQPFVRPALEEQAKKFKSDLKNLVK